MIAKFDRLQIAEINNEDIAKVSNRKMSSQSQKVAVPQEETFKHVYNNAKKGNEFAAVLIDEWQKNCCPRNEKEQQIVQLINRATNKIFK